MLHYTYIALLVEKYLDKLHNLKSHKLLSVMTELHNIELVVHVPHSKSLYQQCHYMLYSLATSLCDQLVSLVVTFTVYISGQI